MDNLIEVNPFTDEFVKGEIEFMQYDMDKDLSWRGLDMRFREVSGRCDDYLNKNYRCDDWKTPILLIDGQLWMSLTAMEIQSSFFSWWGASGDTAMLGLGTGYTALRAASNPAVDTVTVFEIDQRVVDFFLHTHEGRSELEKIHFVVGDVRETFQGKQFDCVFADIYQAMLPDEIISDIEHFHENNDIGWYRFWGQELVQLIALNEEMIPLHCLSMIDVDYLRHWRSTDASNMYGPHIDLPYVRQCIGMMSKYPGSMYIDSDTIMDYIEDYDCQNGEEFCYG